MTDTAPIPRGWAAWDSISSQYWPSSASRQIALAGAVIRPATVRSGRVGRGIRPDPSMRLDVEFPVLHTGRKCPPLVAGVAVTGLAGVRDLCAATRSSTA